MAIHHQHAVELSFIVRDRTGEEDVRTLAQGMVEGQRSEMELMADMLRRHRQRPPCPC
ncbi:DUF305 domain-containing protein [Streptomyces sp. NBC_00160]|uniref:DUF305 domain-containing protein n=1 Tax=Streptomyces sp. NBC_00160 TaxID=2903628 RepID=UPI0022545EA6|nr:DUF305 domain-containing protein [Streptomyces sp. NBC_00160]MCX5302785.1 DUF305 domain-containing protein [Streptomyces sp. NBC_00160]